MSNIQFPIIDGLKKYQDFSGNMREATILNLASDRSILRYLEEEMESRLNDIKREGKRAYNLIMKLEREEEKTSHNVHIAKEDNNG